jgi:hypothetical protein
MISGTTLIPCFPSNFEYLTISGSVCLIALVVAIG